MQNDNGCRAYMESASEFAVIAHLHIDAFIETEANQIQRLLHSVHWRWLQSEYHASDTHSRSTF